jgi:hypothetical protein
MTIDMAALENLRRDRARQRPRRATCDDGQMLGPQEDVHLVADGKRSKRGGRRLDGNIADHYCPVKSRTNSAGCRLPVLRMCASFWKEPAASAFSRKG